MEKDDPQREEIKNRRAREILVATPILKNSNIGFVITREESIVKKPKAIYFQHTQSGLSSLLVLEGLQENGIREE